MAYPQEYLGNAASLLPDGLKSFFFLRHGRTDWNEQSFVQGSHDVPLNIAGQEQARAVGPVLARQTIQCVVASPLSRAFDTAKLATSELDLQIMTDKALKERDFGKHEGTIPPEKMYRDNYEDCERTEDFSRRIAKALSGCCVEGTLLVAHGGVLRVILSLLKTNVDESSLDNACILRFDRVGTEWRVTIPTIFDNH